MASYIGRFTLPFLCRLDCERSYLNTTISDKPVRIIGWRDLCQPEKLIEYAKALRESLLLH